MKTPSGKRFANCVRFINGLPFAMSMTLVFAFSVQSSAQRSAEKNQTIANHWLSGAVAKVDSPKNAKFAITSSTGNESRHFQFRYRGAVEGTPKDSVVKIWIPIATTTSDQTINDIKFSAPVKGQVTQDEKYGNQIYFFQTNGGSKIEFEIEYDVIRKELAGLIELKRGIKLEEKESRIFLSPNTKVPLTGKQLRLLDNLDLSDAPLDLSRQLYDRVHDYLSYDKSKPGYGNGDVHWACDSRTGNCTDFHSMFISLARGKNIPAKFEIGFPLPPGRGEGQINGYHCWAKFFVDGLGWIPVDISEADKNPDLKDYYFGNLTEDRIAFSVGRDIELEPKQAGKPLNYFVYPYVEVDGVLWPKEKVNLVFRYRDSEDAN